MRLLRFFRSVIGANEPTTYVEGTVVDGPTRVGGDGAHVRCVVFRLDSCPDLRFQQRLSSLSPVRHRGDRVRVHYLLHGALADVQWVESL